MRNDPRNHRFDFIQESCAQTVLGSFVERDRFPEFRFCARSESRIQFRKLAQVRENSPDFPGLELCRLEGVNATLRLLGPSSLARRHLRRGKKSQSTSISFALSPGERLQNFSLNCRNTHDG